MPTEAPEKRNGDEFERHLDAGWLKREPTTRAREGLLRAMRDGHIATMQGACDGLNRLWTIGS